MSKITKQMMIGLTDDEQCAVQVSPDMDAATAFQLIGTLALHILNAFNAVAIHDLEQMADPSAILDSVPASTKSKSKLSKKELEAAKIGIKESMYDAMNSVFSTVLVQFYPDAPRSDLEDEAIIELVNDKIEQRYRSLSEKERKQYKRNYEKMKAHLKNQVESQEKPTVEELVGEDENANG